VNPVLAIDGPAGSGKSTVARAVAAALGLPVLETGAMYRAVTWAVLREGIDPAAEAEVALLAGKLRIEAAERVTVDGEDITEAIRAPEVTAHVSAVAAHPEVRTILVAAQRAWIAGHGAAVVEGRDIGTVVAPDAVLKVYLAASDEERARRRHLQDAGPGAAEAGEVPSATLDDIRRRDRIDSTRADSPLAVADDAVVVDTTGRTPEEVVADVVARYRAATAPPAPATPEASPPQRPGRAELAFWVFARGVVVGLARLLWRPAVKNAERLPRTGTYIIAPSHRSFLDTPFVACLTRRRIRYMGKREMWKYPSLGKLFSYLGAFPVDRGVADRAALRAAQAVLEGDEPLVMFPEGTRREGPHVVDLYDGVAYLALKTGVTIVPVGIGGSETILGRGRKFPRLTRVALVVGEPITPPVSGGTVRRRDIAALTEQLRLAIQANFDEAQALLS
jgi:cytidylate kinase